MYGEDSPCLPPAGSGSPESARVLDCRGDALLAACAAAKKIGSRGDGPGRGSQSVSEGLSRQGSGSAGQKAVMS